MPNVVFPSLSTHEAKSHAVHRVVACDPNDVKEWHVELVGLVRCINLYTVGVLLDNFVAIRGRKEEGFHQVLAVLLHPHKVRLVVAPIALELLQESEWRLNM
jgi:hypothetical protein